MILFHPQTIRTLEGDDAVAALEASLTLTPPVAKEKLALALVSAYDEETDGERPRISAKTLAALDTTARAHGARLWGATAARGDEAAIREWNDDDADRTWLSPPHHGLLSDRALRIETIAGLLISICLCVAHAVWSDANRAELANSIAESRPLQAQLDALESATVAARTRAAAAQREHATSEATATAQRTARHAIAVLLRSIEEVCTSDGAALSQLRGTHLSFFAADAAEASRLWESLRAKLAPAGWRVETPVVDPYGSRGAVTLSMEIAR